MQRKRKDDCILEVEDHLGSPYIPYTSKFLDERQQAELLPLLKRSGREYHFLGGFEEAARKILVLVPEYESLEDQEIPVSAIVFNKPCRLNHRNVLGTLMSLGIERDVIGDISIWEDKVQVVVHQRMLEYLKNNFNKINGRSIKLKSLDYEDIIPFIPEYDSLSSTVTSNRLDAVAARVFGISRDKAAAAIRRGDITHNYLPALKTTRPVEEGDTISMKRKGKVRISTFGERTKKNKLRFNYLKYK